MSCLKYQTGRKYLKGFNGLPFSLPSRQAMACAVVCVDKRALHILASWTERWVSRVVGQCVTHEPRDTHCLRKERVAITAGRIVPCIIRDLFIIVVNESVQLQQRPYQLASGWPAGVLIKQCWSLVLTRKEASREKHNVDL
jgi:hypothetical protein